MTYLALYDNQTGNYLHTGRNSTSLKQLADELRQFYQNDGSDEDISQLSAWQLADIGDFTIVSSNIKFNESTEF